MMEQMKTNKEYLEQVHLHPLFSGAPAAEFGALMETCTLQSFSKNQRILYPESPRDGLLLILEGLTEVYVSFSKTKEKNQEVLEVLEKGEVIGLSSLADFLGEPAAEQNNYTVEVRAIEESICLYIPYQVMEKVWHREEVRDFVMRHVAVRLRDIYASLAEQVHLAQKWGESDPFIQRVQDVMNAPPLMVEEKESIQHTAEKMVDQQASSIVVVNEKQRLQGIITEKDLVQRVIAADKKTGTAADIMSSSPYTISRRAYYYEAMSSFLMNGIKHLPVVNEDSTSQVVGMITLSDLLKKQNRGKFDVLREIEASSSESVPDVKFAIYEVLGHLIDDGIPILHIMKVVTNLYDRLIRHCTELALEEVKEELGNPPCDFAFFLMGSGGRHEQFMMTDQDHFLVYEEPAKEENRQTNDAYFKKLGEQIVYWLETAGYKRCDGNMMASAPGWRGTINQWEDRIRTWGLRATNENILLGQNFLAFRWIFGSEKVRDQFVRGVSRQLGKSKIFLRRAAELEKNVPVPVLDHPIRALFRVKKEGMDIKKQALFPFHHSLQILSAEHGILGETPEEMIEHLKEKRVLDEPFADELLYAYEVVLHIRVTQSWDRYMLEEENSSEVSFRQMKSRDKEALIQALKAIRSLQTKAVATFGMA